MNTRREKRPESSVSGLRKIRNNFRNNTQRQEQYKQHKKQRKDLGEGQRESKCGGKQRRNKFKSRKLGERQKKKRRERKHRFVGKLKDWTGKQ